MEEFGISILAGGKSSRMGEDKGLMSLFGQSMISYVLEQAEKVSPHIQIISNNSNYKKFGYPVKKDVVENKGPLSGICSALTNTQFDTNLILTCDIPYAKSDLFTHLINNSTLHQVCIAADEERVHPLIGVYKKSCLPYLIDQLHHDQLKILLAIEDLAPKILDCRSFDPIYFKNINSKSDIST